MLRFGIVDRSTVCAIELKDIRVYRLWFFVIHHAEISENEVSEALVLCARKRVEELGTLTGYILHSHPCGEHRPLIVPSYHAISDGADRRTGVTQRPMRLGRAVRTPTPNEE